jgi:hypothetical protein
MLSRPLLLSTCGLLRLFLVVVRRCPSRKSSPSCGRLEVTAPEVTKHELAACDSFVVHSFLCRSRKISNRRCITCEQTAIWVRYYGRSMEHSGAYACNHLAIMSSALRSSRLCQMIRLHHSGTGPPLNGCSTCRATKFEPNIGIRRFDSSSRNLQAKPALQTARPPPATASHKPILG